MSRACLRLSALLGTVCPSWMNAKVNGWNDCLAAMDDDSAMIVREIYHLYHITRRISQVMCSIRLRRAVSCWQHESHSARHTKHKISPAVQTSFTFTNKTQKSVRWWAAHSLPIWKRNLGVDSDFGSRCEVLHTRCLDYVTVPRSASPTLGLFHRVDQRYRLRFLLAGKHTLS